MANIFEILAKPLKLNPGVTTTPSPIPAPQPSLLKQFERPAVSTKLPEPKYTVRKQTFEDVKALPKQAKDFLLPPRGYSEEELRKAKPTVKETLTALPKVVSEVSTGLGSLLGGASIFQKIAETKIGGKLADLGQKQAEFAVPKTAGEAKAMRVVDAATIAPIGSIRIGTGAARLIAKSRNPVRIAEILVDEVKNLDRADADRLAPLLVGVDNEQDVQRTLNKIEYAKNKATNVVEVTPEKLAIASDFKKGKIDEETARKLMQAESKAVAPVFEGYTDLTTNTLDLLKGKSVVSKQFISDLTNRPELKQEEREAIREALNDYPEGNVPVKEFADKVKADLLPLKALNTSEYGSSLHESTSLPSELRGPISNYNERIYQSPVKTSAGIVHFSDDVENYFGHTRIEDLPNPEIKGFAADFPESNSKGGIRRVIEVQSDLYQKGGLDREYTRNVKPRDYPSSPITPKPVSKARRAELAKLEKYNNPTAHFRMVREEVKKAALDGKTKLQFPTGETAMKIEGLGSRELWQMSSSNSFSTMPVTIKPEHLKPGLEIWNGFGTQNRWVVTDVLGDGKFKAVQKADKYEITGAGGLDKWIEQMKTRGADESFDISGKVDTNNPIYKFYEKDLGRYLKNKYNAELVTDAQGVTWWEVKVDPGEANKAVPAYKKNSNARGDLTPAQAEAEFRKLFDKDEVDFFIRTEKIKTGDPSFVADGMYTPGTVFRNPMVQVVMKDGKVPSAVLYHEAFHAYLNEFVTATERKQIIENVLKNKATLPKREIGYSKEGYDTKAKRAEEWAADDFANFIAGKKYAEANKPFYQKILDKIRGWIRKATKLEGIYERLTKRDRSYVRNPSRDPIPEGRFSGEPLPRRDQNRSLSETKGQTPQGSQISRSESGTIPANQKSSLDKSNLTPAEMASRGTGDSKEMAKRTLNNINTIKTRLLETLQDKSERVRQLVKGEGVKVTDDSDPFLAMTLFDGKVGAKIEAGKAKAQAIVEEMKKVGDVKKVRKEVGDYLVARHAPERNTQLGDGSAGITTAEAKARKAEIEAKNPEIVKLADEVQALHNETLDMLHESQIISDDLYRKLRDTYKNHVPLQRVFDDIEGSGPTLGAKGYDVRSTGLKRAKGSQREVEDVLTNIMVGYQEAVLRSEKNLVDLSTLKFVQENKEAVGDLFEITHPRALGKSFDEDAPRLIMEQTQDPQILQLFDKGKKTWIKIKDPKLAVALRGVGKEKLGGAVNAIATFTRLYSGLNTRFNPEFALPNKIRDLQETMVYLSSQKDIGLKGALKTAGKDPESVKDVIDALRGKDTEGARLYAEMKAEGGTTGGFGLSTKKQVEIDLDKLERLANSKTKRIANNLVEYVDNWNTIFEDSTRLSVYRQARESGLSKKRAAALAKEASINFNRMGTSGPFINALWMFSNASIQGSVKMLRSLKNPKVLGAVTLAVGTAVAATAEWNDQADPEWRDKVPKWDRMNGLTVVMPSTDGTFRYFTIPVSWGIKPIKVMADYAVDAATGNGFDGETFAKDTATTLLEAYNPAGGTDFISAVLPTVFDTPVEIGRNKNWNGNQIKPTKYDPNQPEDTRYFDSLDDTTTGKTAISISELLQGNFGIAISPADMKYAYDQYVGGAGRAVSKTVNLMTGAIAGDIPPVDEYPFVSRFYRETPEDEIRMQSTETDILKQLNTEEARANFKRGREADKVVEELKGMSPQEIAKKLGDIQKSDPQLFAKIKETAKDEAKGLTSDDRLIKSLGVENGERARYIVDRTRRLKSPEEITKFLTDLKAKGLLTSGVIKQMAGVLKQ